MLPNRFAINGLTFAENESREVRVPRGYLLLGLVLAGDYTDTVSADATAVRAYASPIKSIEVITDGGTVAHSIKPSDLVRENLLLDQTPIAAQLTVPAAVTAGARTGSFVFSLNFAEAFAENGVQTALPSWIYDEVILRINWGGHAQVMRGGAGVVTMQNVSLTGSAGEEDLNAPGDPKVWGRQMRKSGRSYKEVAAPAVAQSEFTIDVPRDADLRSIMIVAEDANGDASDAIVTHASLEIDNHRRQFNKVPWGVVRMENAKVYGVQVPAGTAVLEFAEDRDLADLLEAERMSALTLILGTSATAGTIRAVFKKIRTPR